MGIALEDIGEDKAQIILMRETANRFRIEVWHSFSEHIWNFLAAVRRETGARVVHALHHYEPWWRNAEKAVAKRLDPRARKRKKGS